MLIETFIRKQLHLNEHTVTKVEETDECVLVYIDRLGKRLLRCGVCQQVWHSGDREATCPFRARRGQTAKLDESGANLIRRKLFADPERV